MSRIVLHASRATGGIGCGRGRLARGSPCAPPRQTKATMIGISNWRKQSGTDSRNSPIARSGGVNQWSSSCWTRRRILKCWGRLGRYEIERLIGSGVMGIVFKAHDTELNRPVAIKMLAPYLASSGPARQRFAPGSPIRRQESSMIMSCQFTMSNPRAIHRFS